MSTSHGATAWHARGADAVCTALDVDPARGLADAEAGARLQRHGPNRLAEKAPRPVWLKFLDQFRSVLIGILLCAALLAGLIGDIKDAVVIAVVVLLNAALGFYQEHRAENALAALRNMLAPTARVRRDGQAREVAADELVPGDILLLEAGDRIPADARIVQAHGAEVAEAALTGESHAVGKAAEAVAEQAPLAERIGMVFMNTVVTRGRIEAVVTATGMHTEMGRLAGLLAETPESPTPLQVQLDALGKRLALIASVVVGLMFVAGLMRGDDLVTTAMTAIALAVAAIPEGLPAVVTVTLALGMHRMARRHVIVKKLAAVETLGCTTVICSDKTGTLTLNQMTARALFSRGQRLAVEGEGYGPAGRIVAARGGDATALLPVLLPAALCADARLRDGQLIGDPTEGALLALAIKGGVDPVRQAERSPRIAEVPFDSAQKFMATFHHDGEAVQVWVKGAPDVLIGRATRILGEDGELALDDGARARLSAQNRDMADKAMRVLALAGRRIPARDFDPAGDLAAWVSELTLCGLVGIIDPPRPEARESIALCRDAGIKVKMITGDHPVTAAAIARELGLAGEVHEGRELDGLDLDATADLVERSAVFARVAPEHKLRIVEALKRRGHVVAMTGDGVNDAPALKNADIGVAMGVTGTEVTKEAATLVLTDDNFASIVRAVQEGRTIYENIVKFVRFQLSTN
ncbi:MAG TPA: HAD-IC family P-type ATPase, partial [Rhodocyclaceae bacterium]|nr:HAD-IC family P-type ATPase [Rhodocyclaceae bacterium]